MFLFLLQHIKYLLGNKKFKMKLEKWVKMTTI